MIDEKVLATLLTPLRLASKALYEGNGPDTERMGPAIGRAARYLVREGDTVIIVGEDRTWFSADIHGITSDEVSVEIYRKGGGGFIVKEYPWDRVRLPWRHYDDHIHPGKFG